MNIGSRDVLYRTPSRYALCLHVALIVCFCVCSKFGATRRRALPKGWSGLRASQQVPLVHGINSARAVVVELMCEVTA